MNAVEPRTAVPIHKHPTEDETFVILRGKVRVTTHNDDGVIVDSTGCILNHSILIKQVEKKGEITFYHLYSWDIEDSNYTHIVFDNGNALDDCYSKVKDADMNLSRGDIVDNLNSIGINMEHVTHVLTDQNKDTLTDMFTLPDGTEKSSFSR